MWSFLHSHLEELLGAIILAVMATITFLNVLVRYCTSFSFAWSEELTTNFFVWIVLLGTACAFRDNSNLCVGLFYSKMPQACRKLCYVLGLVLSVTFFVILGITGVFEIIDEIELERVSDSLELPYWIYSSAVPLFSALIIVRILERAWHDFAENRI